MRSHRGIKTLWIAAAALLAAAAPAFPTVINIPNGGFTSPANNGSIGGGILSPSGTATIGSGPWSGTYTGALGVLAPPTLTIGSNAATISGVAAINVLGIVSNGGDFTTTLNSAGSGANFAYMQNTAYTLTANISASTVLSLNLLQTDGVGIELTNGSTVLASTAISPSLLQLVSGNTYQLSLSYAIGATGGPTGNAIGIELYDIPAGLVTANVLPSVSFSNVTLSSVATPEPAAILLSAAGLMGLALFQLRTKEKRHTEPRP